MPAPEPLFLRAETAPGQPAGLTARFALHHRPASGQPLALVVHVHALAEEMNKSRRMVALQARALAQRGFAVLQLDLLGCGDSAGDFADADWQAWRADVRFAMCWLRAQWAGERGAPPLWLWGLRAGCLLAADAAHGADGGIDGAAAPDVAGLLLWHPNPSGRVALQQFLRIRTAADAIGGGQRSSTDALRRALRSGEPVDVAGYRVSPGLAQGLDEAVLKPPPARCAVHWFELAATSGEALAPAAAATVSAWRSAGLDVQAQTVAGPAFWQTSEIEVAPALLAATLAAADAGLLQRARAETV